MPLITKKEFAEKAGIATKALSVYVKRGKVLLSDDGEHLDDGNAVNLAFLQHQTELRQRKPGKKASVEKKEKGKPGRPKGVKNGAKKKVDSIPKTEINEISMKRLNLEAEKRKAEVEKLNHQTAELKLRQEKMMGRVIPTDLVKGLFAQHFKSVGVAFRQAADQIITEFAKRTKMDRNSKAEMNKEVIRAINKAIDDSIHLSKKEIAHIVTEYSN